MIRCLIIDDEPLARDIISAYIKKHPDLEAAGSYGSALEAAKHLREDSVDILFLDIEMPDVTGLDFLKTLDHPPAVIIVTAYREYALEGFELDVLDYLLKPVSFERFLKAINKYYRISSGTDKQYSTSNLSSSSNSFIYVKEERKMRKIFLSDILYIESMRDYCILHTGSGKATTKMTLSSLEEKLPGDFFLRIHRSYIVAIAKITAFTPVSVEIGKKELVIGRSYQQLVLNRLKNDTPLQH
jgi:DNA-binding LytR/AlgR family response regulator